MTKTHVANLFVVIAYSVILLGMAVIYINQIHGRQRSVQNNAYIRVSNCILSIPATTRTQVNIDSCYTRVENDLDVKLQRYTTQ